MSSFSSSDYIRPANPASFGGITKIKRHYNTSVKNAKDILSNVASHQLHREVKKPAITNAFYVYFMRQQIQGDLCDIRSLAGANDGFKYLFVAIDMFTKFVFCRPMLSKYAHESVSVMKEMVESFDPPPREFLSDNGGEFTSASVKRYLRSVNVKQRFTRSNIKCGGVERVNRTLQSKIYKYLTQNNTDRYIDVLPDIVYSYNNTVHRTIKTTPALAELQENHLQVRDYLMDFYNRKRKKPKFKVGDVVVIEKERTIFRRGYHQLFNPELFVIDEVHTRMPIPLYRLWSLEKDDEILGTFYANELNKIGNPRKVEEILDRRIKDGIQEIKVKWKGFHENFNSWIPAI